MIARSQIILHFNSHVNKTNFIYSKHLVVLSPLADLMPRLGCLIASISLHKTLLVGIMRAPTAFFDTTPTGRILSRFSKDIEVIDTKIPTDLSDLIYVIFEVNVLFASFFYHPHTHTHFLSLSKCIARFLHQNEIFVLNTSTGKSMKFKFLFLGTYCPSIRNNTHCFPSTCALTIIK